MVKRRRETDSDGGTTSYRTVFLDTSLGTHLAMIVSNSDTVSDFKKKIVLEHMQCFAEIGDLRVHSLKVKRRAKFYHLPDIMLVWSVFQGVKGSWFLSADASGTPACLLNENPSELHTSNGARMGLMTLDDNGLSSDINRIRTLAMSLPDGVTEKSVVPGELMVDKSLEKATDFERINYSDENVMEIEPRAKKRKMSHKEDVYHNPSLKDTYASQIVPCQDASKPNTSCVDAVKDGPEVMVRNEQQGKPTMSEATAEVSGVRNDESNNRDGVAFDGTSVPATEEKSNIESIVNSGKHDKMKEDSTLESIIPENAPTDHQGCVAVKVPDSTISMNASDAMRDVNSDGKKRKTKKAKKKPGKIQDTSDMERNRKGENIKLGTETHKSGEQEGEKELIMTSYGKASDHAGPEFTLNGASFSPNIMDANVVMEPVISSGNKRKKKKKGNKSDVPDLEKSGMEQTENGVSESSGLLYPSTDHIPEETDKGESIAEETSEKVEDANRNVADFVTLTRAEQIVEDVSIGKEEMGKTNKSSAGNCHADLLGLEKENQIVEFNQVEKNSENTKNKDRKGKKKSKKSKLTVSDVLEKLPIKDKKVGLEVLTTEENLSSLVKSEQEHKSEKKPEEMNVTSLNSDDLAIPFENKGDGINFKQYFIASQDHDKVDSDEKVKKATKSNAEMKTRKKVKENGLPSVSISTELQSSLKSFENQGSESKSRVRKTSGGQNGDSAHNSDLGEVNPNSIERSLIVSGNGVKDSSSMTTLQKPNVKEKNRSLDKSSLERLETLPKSRGNNKMTPSLNVSNKMVVKTPLKRSLLSKSGALFEDNSDESSSDENGILHFDASIRTPPDSPSDSSSQSGNSVGESDLSRDSTRNGSNDKKERSTGGKNMLKLDLSASKELTMDMILRSSKRFKKAKILLSKNEQEQNESQDMEFVPDSLPNP
ncbi:hypothetical protein BUALT_Bualt17G0028500 [Buddleja alternifolia]|uniref:Uncharacterized protein n=1 Tax=Buddleja alternifolia TaxID=168488 RepID=A0AAV6WGB1_9LAMI|nr:hypothetical protein BUALT_Bualt17G0028500 [Buddleja alternifolia]